MRSSPSAQPHPCSCLATATRRVQRPHHCTTSAAAAIHSSTHSRAVDARPTASRDLKPASRGHPLQMLPAPPPFQRGRVSARECESASSWTCGICFNHGTCPHTKRPGPVGIRNRKHVPTPSLRARAQGTGFLPRLAQPNVELCRTPVKRLFYSFNHQPEVKISLTSQNVKVETDTARLSSITCEIRSQLSLITGPSHCIGLQLPPCRLTHGSRVKADARFASISQRWSQG